MTRCAWLSRLLVPGVAAVLVACAGETPLATAELTALFAGRTVEGYQEQHEYHFQSYYEPDGRFRSYQGDERRLRRGRWWAREGRICIRWDDGSRDLCRIMVRRGDRFLKLKADQTRRVLVTFVKFTEGNPHRL